ncbi:MAG: UDP-N-acetylmuramate--L-alanine ligase [Burkholderiales bacterium]|jgi:UDP-N-acetylmuramate--alanine ligase
MRHKVKHVHFVGIGGSGMSGIAEVMRNLDFKVTGSDLSENAAVAHLRSLGVHVDIGHARENIAGADVIVTSTAVKADNPEVAAARAKRIPVVPRAMMLAELMRLKQGIAVAGTHGKTTTTSLIASVLAEAGMDPTFVIGGRLEAAGSHAKLGTGEFIVVEADESDASFLYLQPVVAVVTNIDSDHMETYGHDFGRLRQAFLEFVEHLPFYGTAVLCIDDENVRSLLPIMTKTVTSYGLSESAHVRAVDIVHSGSKMQFRVTRRTAIDETQLPELAITLNMPGEHNVRNALATIAVATELGVPDDAIVRALAGFRGVGRRFQSYGEIALGNGKSFTLIDDYGHHPAEIAPTIDAVRGAFPGRRVVLAFQPHRFTRTRDCFEDFVRVLSSVDVLLLTEVYAAGENPIVAADGRALVRAIRVAGKVEPIFVEDVAELAHAIRETAKPGDVVVTMGAGSIGSVPAAVAGAEMATH